MKERRIPMDDGLSTALRPVAAPRELRERLLREARRSDRPRRWMRHLGLAACFALGAVGLALSLFRAPEPGVTIARQAAQNHTTIAHLDFQGAPPETQSSCGHWCESRLGFEAPLPKELASSQVMGGRVCSVASRPVAYYQLEGGRGLYVFREPLSQLKDIAPCSFTLPEGFTARVWNEDGRGYLLLEPVKPKP